jgi:hypothetical protein
MFINQGLPINPHPLVTTDASSEQLANGTWTNGFGNLQSGDVDMLETMNFVVAERMSFVDDYIRSYELDKECRKHIFPVYKSDPIYVPLILAEFSGAFAFLFILFSLCFGVLLLENIAIRFETKMMEEKETVKSFEIQYLLIDETTEDAQRAKIFAKYLELLELINTTENIRVNS